MNHPKPYPKLPPHQILRLPHWWSVLESWKTKLFAGLYQWPLLHLGGRESQSQTQSSKKEQRSTETSLSVILMEEPHHSVRFQSVLNYMWGKGKRLEIHNNPLNHSTLVIIPSEYLRQKILEKNIWYVGDSMFHTAQWSSAHSKLTPPLKAIQIWAHFTDIPLDLRHEEGYSLAGGLVGEPKEVDEFTKNLVSLPMSHIKVEVDLTVSLPTVVESERENGEVVELAVTYPWVPLTCSHCHELGHIVRNCLLYTPPLGKTSSVQKRIYVSKNPAKTPAKTKKNSHQTPKATGETSTKQKLNDIETTPSKTSTPSNTAP